MAKPLMQAATQAPAMDSKAMADSFLEALRNGTPQPMAQESSTAGTCLIQEWYSQEVALELRSSPVSLVCNGVQSFV